MDWRASSSLRSTSSTTSPDPCTLLPVPQEAQSSSSTPTHVDELLHSDVQLLHCRRQEGSGAGGGSIRAGDRDRNTSHPGHPLFSPLPSWKRYRTPRAKTNRLRPTYQLQLTSCSMHVPTTTTHTDQITNHPQSDGQCHITYINWFVIFYLVSTFPALFLFLYSVV